MTPVVNIYLGGEIDENIGEILQGESTKDDDGRDVAGKFYVRINGEETSIVADELLVAKNEVRNNIRSLVAGADPRVVIFRPISDLVQRAKVDLSSSPEVEDLKMRVDALEGKGSAVVSETADEEFGDPKEVKEASPKKDQEEQTELNDEASGKEGSADDKAATATATETAGAETQKDKTKTTAVK